MWKVTMPLHLTLKRKRVKDRKVPLSMNWFNWANVFEVDNAKKTYKEFLLSSIDIDSFSLKTPCCVIYTIFPPDPTYDTNNWTSIHAKFFEDALVSECLLLDDSVSFVPHSFMLFGGIDKENPRMEIEVIRCELPLAKEKLLSILQSSL